METVMLQNPDLIVGWASSFDKKTLRGTDFWEGRGVGTYIAPGSSSKIKVHTIDYEYQDILNLGKIFDREEKAQELVSKMQDEIERAEGKAQKWGIIRGGLSSSIWGRISRSTENARLQEISLRLWAGSFLASVCVRSARSS